METDDLDERNDYDLCEDESWSEDSDTDTEEMEQYIHQLVFHLQNAFISRLQYVHRLIPCMYRWGIII